jgi:hypothetical protein
MFVNLWCVAMMEYYDYWYSNSLVTAGWRIFLKDRIGVSALLLIVINNQKHMSKKLLILQACGHKQESLECDNIKTHAKHYGMEVHDYCVKDNDHFQQIMLNILENQLKYDYIFLSSHGDSYGFISEDELVQHTWEEFGVLLCSSDCLNEQCVVMLSCCRGGLNHVAYELFYACGFIDFVIGPRQNLSSVEMINAFNIIMFNTEHRDIDPVRACKKVAAGIDIRMMCFDREETTERYNYIQFAKHREKAALEAERKRVREEKAKERLEKEQLVSVSPS